MRHLGNYLRDQIAARGLKKAEIAENAGITAQDLSGTFTKEDLYVSKWEKLCVAIGIDPAVAFDDRPNDCNIRNYSDERKALRELIQEKERVIKEKERMIQFLLKSQGIENV